MSGWRIDPAGTNTVVTTTGTASETLATTLATAGDDAVEQLGAGGGLGVAASALAELVGEQRNTRGLAMVNRSAAVVYATVGASNAYLAGDEAMASSTQAAMEQAATTGDLTLVGYREDAS